MPYLPEAGYKRVAVLFMYAAIAVLALKYLLPLLLPFIVAWFIALILQPLVRAVSRATKIPHKPAAVILLIIALLVIGFGVYLAIGRVANELTGLSGYLADKIDELSELVRNFADSMPLPDFLTNDGRAAELLLNFAKELVSGLSSKLPAAFSALPDGVFFTVVTCVAAFYITTGFAGLNEKLMRLLPPPASDWLRACGERLRGKGAGYLRAYAVIMSVTFCELFVGFLIIDIDYAFTVALLCAAADLLPVIGVGTILIPWSALMLLDGQYYIGFALLIIWGVTALVRQIIEPRVVGGSIGLDPLVTLVAMYVGYKCAGLAGMICAPLLSIMISGAVKK